MKAHIKTTGEIFDIKCVSLRLNGKAWSTFGLDEVEVLMPDLTPDYWTRLEHQYAGMAMQGILAHEGTEFRNYLPQEAKDIAHALVEKYKKEEK